MQDTTPIEAIPVMSSADKDIIQDQVKDVPNAEDAEIRSRFSYKEQNKLLWKVDLHVMPWLILAYLIKNMDGNVISYVKTLQQDTPAGILNMLDMTTDQYAWLSTIFSIPFILIEIPSNAIMKVTGPRVHFVRIVGLWSVAAVCQAAARNFAGIMVARFFLGLFEGGLYPGIIVFLTSWYRPDEIAVRIALVDVLGQFSGVFNALLSYALTSVPIDSKLKAWQALFIIEGGIGFFMAAALWTFLPNYPDTARFLTNDERDFVESRLPPNAIRGQDKAFDWNEAKLAMTEPTTYAFWLMSLAYNTASSGYQFWLPTIISNLGFTGAANSQLLNIPPAVIYLLAAIGGAWINQKLYQVPRPIWMLFVCAWSIICFALMAVVTSDGGLYAIICIASIPVSWNDNILVSWRTQSLKGATHAAFVFAFQNAFGQLSGFYTAQIFQDKYAPRYVVPFAVSCGFWGAMMLLTFWLWKLTYKSERDTRMFAKQRHAYGKATNQVLQDDIEL